MPGDPNAVTAALTIFFGALAGGMTNAVAIWMLFHPYERRGIGPLRLHGAIPKSKARLAKTIGRTVGQRLLGPDDLSRHLATPETRAAFDAAVRRFVAEQLEREHGSLRELLPAPVRPDLDRAIDTVGQAVARRIAAFAEQDTFADTVARALARAHRELADRPVGEVLTEERRAAIRTRVEAWAEEAVRSPQLDETVRHWLERQVERWSRDTTPLLDRLPPDLVAAIEREIAAYLPVALEQLAGVLRDPEARARIQRALHELFQRFVRDLLLHERLVARLVVTERTIGRLLATFERQGLDELTALLDEPAMRAQIARSVNDAVVAFLRRPVAEHLERLGPERTRGIVATATRHITTLLRDPGTRSQAVAELDRLLVAAEQRTWGDLLRYLPPDRVARWAADAAQTPRLREWLAEAVTAALDALVARPLGRLSSWLPEASADRLTAALAPTLWDWIEQQIPTVVAQVDVPAIVEQKVLGFSLARIEEIIRSTTQRELDLIVRLGYVLGAVVGAIAYGVTLLVGRG